MKKAQMHLINKMFNDETIRMVWNKKEEKYYVSVVDIIGVLTDSTRVRKYWGDLKRKLKDDGSEVSEKIGQFLKVRKDVSIGIS